MTIWYLVALKNGRVWGTYIPFLKLNIFVEDAGNCTADASKISGGAKDKHFTFDQNTCQIGLKRG